MLINFENELGKYCFDDKNYHNISLKIKKTNNVSCYQLEDPSFSYFKNEFFSGSLNEGGSVNCEKINFYAHSCGTHTETALHVDKNGKYISDIEIPSYYVARLISINPVKIDNDLVITKKIIENLLNDNKAFDALIIRTYPNELDKKRKNYANTNPPFLTEECACFLKSLKLKHILVDLPSIDKESDEGKLLAHKAWFFDDDKSVSERLITELIFIENHIKDGLYVLKTEFPMIETDAVPSKISIYPLI